MTEEIAATPGWVDQRLDEIFRDLPQTSAVSSCREQYAGCLATQKEPAAPTDALGAEFNRCRSLLMAGLAGAGLDEAALDRLTERLERLEAEIAEQS